MRFPAAFSILLCCCSTVTAATTDDILIADFESETYGDWKAEGNAFGPGPARGTLPNQMTVSGFLGDRLVNSYFQGDESTGRLISPPFQIQRRFINFLIGGGKYPNETCINLMIDGRVARSATGPNDQPGGSERLDWHTWSVSEFAGRTGTIEIVDARKGGWGHINVDHIVQSDSKRQAELLRRELTIEQPYLHLPVKTGATKRQMRLSMNGQIVREFEIELADGIEPDFWAFCDVGSFQGQRLAIEVVLPSESKALSAITQDKSIRTTSDPDASPYAEPRRPQFHFTSRCGWLNDPNGLVYYKGEYHLFYQHNPYGWDWGNMHWGHAVSGDLVHWKELPIALYPQRFGDWCFSGSAVVDRKNTAGLKRGEEDVLVAAYTSTGRGESITTSIDRGRTWTELRGNPVVRHRGRDPKLVWHEPSQRWVMAVYDELDESRDIAFYTSPNFRQWELQSRIEGFYECPDLMELPLRGPASEPNPDAAAEKTAAPTKWALYAADGRYVLGSFDGRQFVRESGPYQVWYGNFYAAQTFSNAPDGRNIQIGWGRGITFPGMPFNQQMTIPVELTLRTTGEGARMFVEPVRELELLRGQKHSIGDTSLNGEVPLEALCGDQFDIAVEFELGKERPSGSFGLSIRGIPVSYDSEKQALTCRDVVAPLKPIDQRVRLRILVDRGSIEIFGNDGQVALSVGVHFPDNNHAVSLFSRGSSIRVPALTAYELQSIW